MRGFNPNIFPDWKSFIAYNDNFIEALSEQSFFSVITAPNLVLQVNHCEGHVSSDMIVPKLN